MGARMPPFSAARPRELLLADGRAEVDDRRRGRVQRLGAVVPGQPALVAAAAVAVVAAAIDAEATLRGARRAVALGQQAQLVGRAIGVAGAGLHQIGREEADAD